MPPALSSAPYWLTVVPSRRRDESRPYLRNDRADVPLPLRFRHPPVWVRHPHHIGPRLAIAYANRRAAPAVTVLEIPEYRRSWAGPPHEIVGALRGGPARPEGQSAAACSGWEAGAAREFSGARGEAPGSTLRATGRIRLPVGFCWRRRGRAEVISSEKGVDWISYECIINTVVLNIWHERLKQETDRPSGRA